jgi:UDP-N-acetylmuramoyl-tripeptide--D-alanyl-D-alanine ligase
MTTQNIMKMVNKLFPIIDHLYIFQLFEYNSTSFLKWFIKYPLKRNLQRKHQIEWTKKSIAIFVIALLIVFLESVDISTLLLGNPSWTPVVFLVLQIFSPIYLIIGKWLITPYEIYAKDKILTATKNKLEKLPNLKVVAITGSFGKTSTKEILYVLLKKKFRTIKTPKSFNTPLGVAGSVLDFVKDNTEVLIAEVGAYKKGEIKNIANLIKPQIGIITAVAPQHLERFGSIENIARAKFELVESLIKDGLAILNYESDWLKKLSSTAHCKVIFYNDDQTIYATNIKSTEESSKFTLNLNNQKIDIELPLVGEHHIKNFLAASAAALNLGLTLKEIQTRAKWILPTSHRLEIRKQGSITIIDNSYNTNTVSSRSSLKLLENYPGKQKILLTPGLVELGNQQTKENEEFAKDASKIIDDIILVGELNKKTLLSGLKDFPKNHIYKVESTKEAFKKLSEIAKPEAVALLENDLPDQYF